MKIVDLFCGAGGMSLGFEEEGFKSVLAVDLWEDAIKTYNFNRKHQTAKCIDIHELDDSYLDSLKSDSKIHGIIGGPPCQGFSSVGKRDENDNRNSLYLEYVRFVEKLTPDFFVLENVKGLLTLANGYYKRDIIDRFNEIGYNVNFQILKASDFGVPQNRQRVFFVGLRRDIFGEGLFFDFPKPYDYKISTAEALSDLPSLSENEHNNIFKSQPNNNYQLKMRNSDFVHNHEITHHTKNTIDIISKVKDGGSILDLDPSFYSVRNYKTTFKRMNSKEPSITIDCGHRNYFHFEENRVPTVRESARLQSFFDSYVFKGSKTSQYVQVGNAVPPLLAKVIATQLKKLYKEI